MGPKSRDQLPVVGQEIFTPRPSANPVITRLRELRLYKSERTHGTHDVTCPWVSEHTDQLDSGTAYFEPTLATPRGGFRCHHSHGDRYHVGELIDFLQLSPSQARNRARIRVVAGDLSSVLHAAELALAESGRLYQSGGTIVSVHADPHSGDIHTEAVSDQALTQKLAEAVDWEKLDARSGKWVRCDPPARIVTLLHKAQSYSALPVLRGLARQPFFREEDGELVTRPGYDPVSGKLASFSERQFSLGDTSFDGAKEALARLEKLLEEFHFASDVDRSAALSAMLTAAVRPTLPVAPAFNVTASGIGSGKTYLCSTIIPFAGAGDPQTITYPPTSEEAAKVTLSLLLQAPHAIFFDDMDRDWLAHGPINRMLTSPTTSERILGVSKTVTVSTRTLVMGSGNNVEPLRDLRRRVISIRLSPRTASPAMLSYRGRPAEEVKANRARYVSDALTIIEAWRRAGRPRADAFDIATFNGLWSDYRRQTLMWLGHPDPASSLRDQIKSDPDSEALGDFLEAWFKRFSDSPVTVRRLVGCTDVRSDELKEVLEDLPINGPQGINRSKLGRYLKKQSFRIVRGLQVEPAESSERNAWRVVKVTDDLAESPTPPSTSFRETEPEISPG